MSLIENETCVQCETQCLNCKNDAGRDEVTIPRELAEILFNRCADDDVRARLAKYLNK